MGELQVREGVQIMEDGGGKKERARKEQSGDRIQCVEL